MVYIHIRSKIGYAISINVAKYEGRCNSWTKIKKLKTKTKNKKNNDAISNMGNSMSFESLNDISNGKDKKNSSSNILK
jgi:hypothetical protein